MGSKRRKEYQPIKDWPTYNDEYDRLRVQSNILNSDAVPHVHTILWDKNNIEKQLREYVGNEDGFIVKRGYRCKALLPQNAAEQQELLNQFEKWKQDRVNQGFAPTDEMPKPLAEKLQLLHAKEDLLREEVETLQKHLDKKYAGKEHDEHARKMLAYGPRCHGSFKGIGTADYDPTRARAELDGQYLSREKDPETQDYILVIDDPDSPYHRMKVSDYRRLSDEWIQKRKKMERDKLKKLQREARQAGRPIPRVSPVRGPRKISRGNLPQWPKWAVAVPPAEPIKGKNTNESTNDS